MGSPGTISVTAVAVCGPYTRPCTGRTRTRARTRDRVHGLIFGRVHGPCRRPEGRVRAVCTECVHSVQLFVCTRPIYGLYTGEWTLMQESLMGRNVFTWTWAVLYGLNT